MAGMQACAAVVAQVGEVMDICFAKFQATCHGGEHGTKTFAVATGIANLQLARDLGFRGGEFAIRQSAGFLGEDVEDVHAGTPRAALAAFAAFVPAMRPKAVPIDMPTPAV